MGYGRTQLYNLFKKHTGLTPNEYLVRFRIATAQELLNQRTPIEDVASAVGFSSLRYFKQVFLKYTGQDPSTSDNRPGQKPSVLERMDWGGDASLAGYKSLAGETVHRHHRSVAEKTAELHGIADLFADNRDDADCGRLLVYHSDRRLVRDYAGDCGCGCVAGDGYHIQTD